MAGTSSQQAIPEIIGLLNLTTGITLAFLARKRGWKGLTWFALSLIFSFPLSWIMFWFFGRYLRPAQAK
jgi:hypothetical protein